MQPGSVDCRGLTVMQYLFGLENAADKAETETTIKALPICIVIVYRLLALRQNLLTCGSRVC